MPEPQVDGLWQADELHQSRLTSDLELDNANKSTKEDLVLCGSAPGIAETEKPILARSISIGGAVDQVRFIGLF